jgi:hypothetical protein
LTQLTNLLFAALFVILFSYKDCISKQKTLFFSCHE